MKLSKFMDGLNTLLPYYNNADGFHIGAEHDQFYAYQTDNSLSPEDVKKMVGLGWFQPEGGICEDESDVAYDPENGWSAFT